VHLLTGHDRMSDLDCHLSVEPDPESGQLVRPIR
jgi:hypothetical protein